ncbi:MAG: VacJ family lipoprotein [Deltaproteobacteria bacterium]|nr:VacJ family lipoprotein [Deltaproteobacteria bacterium]
MKHITNKLRPRIVSFLGFAVLVNLILANPPVVTWASAAEERSASQADDAARGQEMDQDPWEPFNEGMFTFNREVDRFVVKPVATVWDAALPYFVRKSLGNAFDNLLVVRRVVNNLLQLKLEGASRELMRFTVNSIFGVGGLFDVAKDGVGIAQSDEDMGQTFGVWGAGSGPYLILPLLPPMTVRDGIGMALDGAMNPLNYFLPIGATLGIRGTDAVNERSLNLDKFERVEETTIDLYGAVRNAYFQRRAAAIRE